MIVKITSKRQVTLPARVLDALGVGPGDRLELVECSDSLRLRPHRIRRDRLAPLRGNWIRDSVPSTSSRSARKGMTPRFGIDTSILVHPFRLARLLGLQLDHEPSAAFAGDQVER